MGRRELIRELINEYCADMPEDLSEFIESHPEEFFSDAFFSDSEIRFRVEEEIEQARLRMGYEAKHAKDTVTLDKEGGMMCFNDHRTPAYWYREGMPQEDIEWEISQYRYVWEMMEFAEMDYPLLESWHTLEDWNCSKATLERMERDLECCDTEDAKVLCDLRQRYAPVYQVFEQYPNKLDRVLKVSSIHEEDGRLCAGMTLKLRNGSRTKVHACYWKNGRFSGMTSLDGKGFPRFTDRDHQIIWKQAFQDFADQ